MWQPTTSRALSKAGVSHVTWCWVAAEVAMQHPALGVKGECFSGAFLWMQKQFLETIFYFTQLLVPELIFGCFSFPSPSLTAPELLQGLGGSGSGASPPALLLFRAVWLAGVELAVVFPRGGGGFGIGRKWFALFLSPFPVGSLQNRCPLTRANVGASLWQVSSAVSPHVSS